MESRVIVREQFTVEVFERAFSVAAAGEWFFTLPVQISLAPEGEEDRDAPAFLIREIREENGGTAVSWSTRSSRWERKEYRLEVGADFFHYTVRVGGPSQKQYTASGRLGPLDIRYFTGLAAGDRAGAAYDTAGYFLPMPRHGEENHVFTMAQDNTLSMQLMVPPPFCFPFRLEGCASWFGLGLTSRPGEYCFDRFHYRNELGRFLLATDRCVLARGEDGLWAAPGILGCPGGGALDVLRGYSRWNFANGCRPAAGEPVRWWKGPFFCGWGEQALLPEYGEGITDRATQAVYSVMSGHLDVLGLHPTAIIIDDKWQRAYGEALPDAVKWPDLRGFAEEEHRKGWRVVLWFKCWSCEGLPADECITLCSQPLAADPTNPRYAERLKRTVHTLLSGEAGCCNCDGFKIDFADCMPRDLEMRTYEEGIRGVELLKRLLTLLYQSAKAAKPDALLNCSGCHPYLAEVTDQVRLHDYDSRMRSIRSCMRFRRELYGAVLPGMLVDTDFPAFGGRRDTIEYLRFAPELGVPDLYRLSDTPDCTLSGEDWAEVRLIWQNYSAGQDLNR